MRLGREGRSTLRRQNGKEGVWSGEGEVGGSRGEESRSGYEHTQDKRIRGEGRKGPSTSARPERNQPAPTKQTVRQAWCKGMAWRSSCIFCQYHRGAQMQLMNINYIQLKTVQNMETYNKIKMKLYFCFFVFLLTILKTFLYHKKSFKKIYGALAK